MDPRDNIYFYTFTTFYLYHSNKGLYVLSYPVSEHASISDVYSIFCCMEKTKNNDGEPESRRKRDKIGNNAAYYYCSFSFDLVAISNSEPIGNSP